MLIECPECKKQISDQSEQCIHCGYPLNKKLKTNICCINGTNYDLTVELDLLTLTDFMQGLRNLRDKYNLSLSDATTLGKMIKDTGKIPKEYKSSEIKEYRKEIESIENVNRNIPHCPICNSTNIKKISNTERVTSIALVGIFSKKINKSFKCNNCGGTF